MLFRFYTVSSRILCSGSVPYLLENPLPTITKTGQLNNAVISSSFSDRNLLLRIIAATYRGLSLLVSGHGVCFFFFFFFLSLRFSFLTLVVPYTVSNKWLGTGNCTDWPHREWESINCLPAVYNGCNVNVNEIRCQFLLFLL